MLIEKENVRTVFKTRDTMFKYFPSSYGELLGRLEDDRESIENAKNMLMEMAFMDKRALKSPDDSSYTSDPLRFVDVTFNEMMESYNDSIYRLCDAELLKEEYESLDSMEKKGAYFNVENGDSEAPLRTISIDGYEVKSMEDIRTMKKECLDEINNVESTLRCICAANPKDITPEKSIPLDYVHGMLTWAFLRLKHLNMLSTKLCMMAREIEYGEFTDGYNTMKEKETYYFENISRIENN